MKAIVLCAGLGTRLGTLAKETPKALLSVNGRPILAHILDWLASGGITEVLVNLHHLPDAIPAIIGDGVIFGLSVNYTYEGELAGTAGTVRAARNWIGNKSVLVVYGDVLTDQELAPMWQQHGDLGSAATLLLHRRTGSNSVVRMDATQRIVSFVERPAQQFAEQFTDGWVNSGIHILSPELVSRIPEHIPTDLPRDVFVPLVDDMMLHGFALTGQRVAVDSPARLEEAATLPWTTPCYRISG